MEKWKVSVLEYPVYMWSIMKSVLKGKAILTILKKNKNNLSKEFHFYVQLYPSYLQDTDSLHFFTRPLLVDPDWMRY